jgi:hypothetical protein
MQRCKLGQLPRGGKSGAYMDCVYLMVRRLMAVLGIEVYSAMPHSSAPLVRLSERGCFPALCRQTLTHAFCDGQFEDMRDDSPS